VIDRDTLPDKVMPFFTIITVVKNGSRTIQRCIDSLRNQTFQDFEYIVIDGMSTDQTVSIIDKNNDVVDYLVSEKDEGLYYAMNKGISLSKGKFIGIINSDDVYHSNALALVNKALQSNPKTTIVYGAMANLTRPNKRELISINQISERMIFHPTCFVSKSVYANHGMFDTSYKIAADYEFIFRCYKRKENFLCLEDTLAFFSSGGLSAKMKLRSIIETSEIQAKFNSESNIYKMVKLIRVLVVTYSWKVFENLTQKLLKKVVSSAKGALSK
jgi:glycosyltransferase involved in cell wall biosynthesis